MIILDTNVVSELLRPAPNQAVATWLDAQQGSSVCLTSVSEAELRYGLAMLPSGKRRDALATAISGILRDLFSGRILPFDSAAAAAYASIASERRAAGRPISQMDCQIAAIAFVADASLATRNERDFDGCGVAVINPWCAAPRG